MNRHWGGLNETSVSTNVTSIVSSHFPFDDDFWAFGPNLSKGRHDQIYAIRFISVTQACLSMTANFVLISGFPDQTNL